LQEKDGGLLFPPRFGRKAPVEVFKDGKLICRGGGNSSLPGSWRERSPSVLTLCGRSPAPKGARAAAPMRLPFGNARGFRALHNEPPRPDCGKA